MNRREFFKSMLGMVGAGLLASSVAQVEEPDPRLTRIYPLGGYGGDNLLTLERGFDDFEQESVDAYMRRAGWEDSGIPDHTHEIFFVLSEEILTPETVYSIYA